MDIKKLLPGHPWADTIEYFASIDSTSTYLQRQASFGAAQGSVVIADSQTAGKGRLGRVFHSPAGTGLYMSVLLRPMCKPQLLMHLTCAVAVAVCDAIEAVTGFCPQVKWVNDIVWQGKKLGGILTGIHTDKDGNVEYAIVGIGINCGHTVFPEALQNIAVSLADVTGAAVDRQALAAELIRRLESMNQQLIDDQELIMDRYRSLCAVIGRQVRLLRAQEDRTATVLDVDNDGGLIVRLADGTVETVNSGEISLRGENSYI